MLKPDQNCDNIATYMNEYMKIAIIEAQKAAEADEVPVGAVIVKDGEIIGRGHNLTRSYRNPTAHAEMVAIRQAVEFSGSSRLTGCDMYVTMEPCAMCAGAMVLSRIRKLFIGTMDPKAGACGSVLDVLGCSKLNHHVEVESGMMEEECSRIVKDFFAELRKRNGGSNK